ncbi:MAG: DUF6428 family protein [Saprospiraceae bacterium]|nr:DUF6428 family protein [Saprospiraceae bacterium]
MKISELKSHLNDLNTVSFQLPNGQFVPAHFHITEVGLLTKHFIDCGGDVHEERMANLQIWVADDFDHRLAPQNFLNILDLSKKILNGNDVDIEVEYQTETIGKYGLDFSNNAFQLVAKETDCLAKVKCNIPQSKPKIRFSELTLAGSGCTPGGGCC